MHTCFARPLPSWALWGLLATGALGWRLAHAPSPASPAEPVLEVAGVEWSSQTSWSVLVDLADDLSPSARAAFVATLPPQARLNSAFSAAEQLWRIDGLAADEARALVARLRDDRHVEFVEPESTWQLDEVAAPPTVLRPPGDWAGTPDDPLYGFQWHFDQIGLQEAWTRSRGQGAIVAVIDTGVAYADDPARGLRAVRDLAGTAMVPGYDFVADHDRPLDEHGHGTHVAGTIAQTTHNGYGVAGIAPRARIMPIRVLDASGRGNTADIAESIRWAADHGAHIINLSLGGPMPSRILHDAVQYAHQKGVIVIAAAGNSGSSMPGYPAAYPNVVSVAATQFDRTTTFYSNWGRTIDIAAPGGNTRVDQNGDGRPDGVLQETLAHGQPGQHDFSLYMGTSMAAPHVAGVAALLHAQGVTRVRDIEALLLQSASHDVPAYTPERFGAGLLDAAAATRSAARRSQTPLAGLSLLAALGLAAGIRRRVASVVLGASATAGAALFTWPALGAGLAGAFMLLAAPLLPLAAYAGFGHLKEGSRGRGVFTGVLAALAALPLGLMAGGFLDVPFLPGHGWLDGLWLTATSAGAWLTARLALRPDLQSR